MESFTIPFELATDFINTANRAVFLIKLTTKRPKVLHELELLIIDEISMVRCDTLDAIDVVLKHVRHQSNEPFGGVGRSRDPSS